MKRQKGFTLIELLVVIAIIGILAAIVLVSLGGARDRARDARIISAMGQLRTLATIFDADNNTYVGFCATLGDLTTDITNQQGTNYSCSEEAATYCAKVQLNSDNWWCVDSALRSLQSPTDPGTACTTSPYTCQ